MTPRPVVLHIDEESDYLIYASPGGRSIRWAEMDLSTFPFICIRLPTGYTVDFDFHRFAEHVHNHVIRTQNQRIEEESHG